jgi:hypothetical protein
VSISAETKHNRAIAKLLLTTIEQARMFGKASVETDAVIITIESKERQGCQSEAKGQSSDGFQSGEPSMSPGPRAVEAASVARARRAVMRLKSSMPNGYSAVSPASQPAQVIRLKS